MEGTKEWKGKEKGRRECENMTVLPTTYEGTSQESELSPSVTIL